MLWMVTATVLLELSQLAGGTSCRGNTCDLSSSLPLQLVGSVSRGQEETYSIHVGSSLPVRIVTQADLDSSNPPAPVLFSLRRGDTQTSWKIPATPSSISDGHTKILCENSLEDDTMKLTVSSRASAAKKFNITLELLQPKDFDLEVDSNKTKEVAISPTAMGLFRFTFPETAETMFLLTVSSLDVEVCSILSVQDGGRCPGIHDEERDMRSGAGTQFQTFLGTAALVLEKARYPRGVHVVLLAQEDDTGCYRKTEKPVLEHSGRAMTVRVAVDRLPASKELATGVVIGLYILTGVLCGLLSFCTNWKRLFEFDSRIRKQQSEAITSLDRQRKKDVKKDQTVGNYVVTFASKLRDGVNRKKLGEDEVEAPAAAASSPRPHVQLLRQEPGQEQGEEQAEVGPATVRNQHKSRRNSKFKWQKTLSEESGDALDGARPSKTLTSRHVRSRHSSENTQKEIPYLKKVVTLDKATLKSLRASDNITLADMAVRSNPEYFKHFMWKSSGQFVWNVFMVGIYYTLPVFQLALYYQNVAIDRGDRDTCYYNFLCQYPWGPIEDFGHVFSNIGYVMCGAFFIMIVKNRSRRYNIFCRAMDTQQHIESYPELHPKHTGIPESYGIFYAMGGAMMMEGVLSACYHICPTAENFQFDTTFMYVISVLTFLKVYQFRHHDITFTGHLVFMWIGFALVFEMIGYFTDHWLFWFAFILIYVAFIVVFVVHVYYHATGPSIIQCFLGFYTASQKKTASGSQQEEQVDEPGQDCQLPFKCHKPHLDRLVPAIGIVVVNILVACFIVWHRTAGVSRYLLVIMMANMLLYINYYVCHKLYYRLKPVAWEQEEGFRPITTVYFLLSLGFMAGAAMFFKAELKTSAGTAAESRNLNDACYVSIFDNHDLWHFLSAAGLFFLFMFILTLEDYNKARRREKIRVF